MRGGVADERCQAGYAQNGTHESGVARVYICGTVGAATVRARAELEGGRAAEKAGGCTEGCGEVAIHGRWSPLLKRGSEAADRDGVELTRLQ